MIIKYGDDDQQFGDLYIPDNLCNLPVIVVIHGGYWRDLSSLDSYPTKSIVDEYKEKYAIWNLEYRRMTEHGCIDPNLIFSDIKNGFEHLSNLNEYNLDLDNILLIGHSAGGHLATWLLGEELIIRPKKAISIAGVLDLGQYKKLDKPEQVIRLLNNDLNNIDYANPIKRGHGKTQLFLVHGLDDQTVPYSMAEAYVRKWDAELILYNDCDHFGMLPSMKKNHWLSLKFLISEILLSLRPDV